MGKEKNPEIIDMTLLSVLFSANDMQCKCLTVIMYIDCYFEY